MFRLKESMHINAPIDRCFLLSTSIELVQRILNMRPVSGVTGGLVREGDRVAWRGMQFGLPARHHSLISRYERPHFFQDTMEKGYFAHFQHDHRFEEVAGYTLLVDVVRFSMPMGPVGQFIGKTIVVPHVLALMLKRFELLKRIAEGPDWEQFLPKPLESATVAPERASEAS